MELFRHIPHTIKKYCIDFGVGGKDQAYENGVKISLV
jgi:hypothetical protein